MRRFRAVVCLRHSQFTSRDAAHEVLLHTLLSRQEQHRSRPPSPKRQWVPAVRCDRVSYMILLFLLVEPCVEGQSEAYRLVVWGCNPTCGSQRIGTEVDRVVCGGWEPRSEIQPAPPLRQYRHHVKKKSNFGGGGGYPTEHVGYPQAVLLGLHSLAGVLQLPQQGAGIQAH